MVNFDMRTNRRAASGCSGCSGCASYLVRLIIGLIFLFFGIFLVKDTLQFMPGTVTAQGTITHCSYNDNTSHTSDAPSSSCSPTVSFITKSGQPITINSSYGSSSFYEGQQVQVRYHPNTPQDGRIDTFIGNWLIPLVCIAAGILVLFADLLRLLRLMLLPLLFMRGRTKLHTVIK